MKKIKKAISISNTIVDTLHKILKKLVQKCKWMFVHYIKSLVI